MITCKDIIDKRCELWEAEQDIDKDIEFREAVAKTLLSNNGQNLRDEISMHPEFVVEIFFVITNKQQQVVPFFLNTIQRKFLKILNEDIEGYEKGEVNHLKYLILKGRQQGFTSLITAYQLASTITKKNFSGFTIADSSDNANTIFEDKAKYPYSLLPDKIKPSEKYNTRKEMVFEKLNSKWRIATANNKEVGRSKTINFLHASECAFWKSISNIMGGLGQALTLNCIQILETTANGFNEYRTIWTGAEQGTNNWKPLFFTWWDTPEYRLHFENEGSKKDFIDMVNNPISKFQIKLKWLRDTKGLEYEQLYWYNSKYKDLGDLLNQEYPCTPEEAFLASGNPIFDNEKVLTRMDFLEKLYQQFKPKRGKFKYKYVNERIIDESIDFIEDENGWLTIYENPMQFYPYVIGGDTAEGGTDFCIGQVINNNTSKQVATFRARMDTDLYAKQMYCLGKYYNTALIGIETNFDLHPIKELERLRYPKLYMRESMDNLGNVVMNKAGFNTNKATKPVIIGDLVEIVREETNLINDIITLKEMLTFIDNDGKYEAVEGEHDDTVIALAITYAIRKQQRTTINTPEKEQARLPYMFNSEEEITSCYEELF